MAVDVVDEGDADKAPKKELVAGKPAAPIALEHGLLAPKDSSEEWRVAELMLKSAALPQQFKNAFQVVVALQFLKEHHLPPMVAIRQTTIINGTLSIWGDLPKALCERSGLLDICEEFVFDKDYKPISFDNRNLDAEIFGAYCLVKRRDRAAFSQTFTVAEAKQAALWTKPIWRQYPRRMMQMRVRSLALKDAFADVLMGVAIAEYDHHAIPGAPEAKTVAGELTTAGELNQAYGADEETGTDQKSGVAE